MILYRGRVRTRNRLVADDSDISAVAGRGGLLHGWLAYLDENALLVFSWRSVFLDQGYQVAPQSIPTSAVARDAGNI